MNKLLFIICLFLSMYSNAQTIDICELQPHRTNEKITIDAQFTETTWIEADKATKFIQSQPQPNEPSSEESEVQIAYDDQAIYVAAKLFVKEGTPILKELGQIDDLNVNAESFFVFFDTFNDDQNGFGFGVTAAGVQQDAKYSPNNEDFQWNGVWESQVRTDENGWYVEMKIPLYNLRFSEKDTQNWGINFLRNIRHNREQAFWNHVDQNVNGFVNQWGSLTDVKSIDPPLRLSFTPFVSTNLGKTTGTDVQADFNAGMDLKFGINESFTLDMTLIPDFGGVRSDEQILNLGPFEQRFDENRAFFTEGTELFGKNRLFYSRRIGQRPSGFFSIEDDLGENERIDENPSRTQLLNATKVSGRTKSNVGLGFFNAVTGKAEARIIDTLTGESRMVQTEALTNFNILVAEKALKNASNIYIINTNVNRAGNARDANVTGIGANLRDKNNEFGLDASFSYSQVFNKDDFDLTRNTKGFKSNLELYRVKDKFVYGAGSSIESDEYNPNDLGLLFGNNENNQYAFIRYNQNEQTNWYRFFGLRGNVSRRSLYKPSVTTGYRYNVGANLWLNNLMGVFGGVFHSPGDRDYFEPQVFDFETYFRRPKRTFSNIGFSTDYNKRLAFDVNIERGFGQDDIPMDVWNYYVSPRFRFSDKLLTVLEYSRSNRIGNVGFASFTDDDLPLFGNRDRQINETELNTEYRFNEKMNVSIFGRYTWDKVDYHSFHTLGSNGELNPDYIFETGESSPENINFSAFNLDAIFRWRFAPGSDIIAVYKKQISEQQDVLRENYFTNFDQLFQEDQSDVLNVKLIYFIDYNTLKKKKQG